MNPWTIWAKKARGGGHGLLLSGGRGAQRGELMANQQKAMESSGETWEKWWISSVNIRILAMNMWQQKR